MRALIVSAQTHKSSSKIDGTRTIVPKRKKAWPSKLGRRALGALDLLCAVQYWGGQEQVFLLARCHHDLQTLWATECPLPVHFWVPQPMHLLFRQIA